MKNYIKINKDSWNKRAVVHYDSDFYDNESFIKGRSSLNSIELDLLGDVTGLRILHLQCHFGQDSISLARMGAQVTAVDFSDVAIKQGQELAHQTNTVVDFICCDIYTLPEILTQEFDIVFTSYGTIGWLPDIEKWANVVSHFLKPEGNFVFAEFHPVVWMFDSDFKEIQYRYFNDDAIIDETDGTYTDGGGHLKQDYVSWNHSLSEVISSLISHNLEIQVFKEYDYSPYNCFKHTQEVAPNQFVIKHFGRKIPMVYSVKALMKTPKSLT